MLIGIMSGTVAFFIVMLLALVYRYFTMEKLSSILGIVFGLGFLGFSGGLLAILEQPTVGGAIQILVVSIFTVWGVNTGDKIAERMPKRSGALFSTFGRRRNKHAKVKLPSADMILDIPARKRVSDSVKAELSEREFILPTDLPIEEVTQRIKKRLVTDWGIGDVELEIDQDGRVIHLAISAKKEGLSTVLPKGTVALPLECKILPSNLVAGDVVRLVLNNNEVIEETEVIGVDNDQKVITIIAPFSSIQEVRDRKAELVVALPHAMRRQTTIGVKRKSGMIEKFTVEKIYSSLEKSGVREEISRETVAGLQKRLRKVEGPITSDLIESMVFEELEKIAPAEAKKLRARKFWRL